MKVKVDDEWKDLVIDTFGNVYILINNKLFELFITNTDSPIFYDMNISLDKFELDKFKPLKLKPKQYSLQETGERTVRKEIDYNIEDDEYDLEFVDEHDEPFDIYGQQIDLYKIEDSPAIYDTYIFEKDQCLKTIVHSIDNSSAYKLKINLQEGTICFRAVGHNDVQYKLIKQNDTVVSELL